MGFVNMARFVLSKRGRELYRLSRASREMYRIVFLARAGETGILELLGRGGAAPAEIGRALGLDPTGLPALEAFLEFGAAVGELSAARGRYALSGALAKAMGTPEGVPLWAMALEIARLHAPYLLAVPGKAGLAASLAALTRSLSMVVACSSRILEPILGRTTDALADAIGQGEILEIGCGSGIYLLRALAGRPGLRAVGVEMEPEVAREAREAVERAGLADRAEVVQADVRDLDFPSRFDCVTMHNNIYYFPEAERLALLSGLRAWLKPGGKLVVSTICPGPGVFARFMNLWSVTTEGAGALPDPQRFTALLGEAGYARPRAERPMPLESFYVFTAVNGQSG